MGPRSDKTFLAERLSEAEQQQIRNVLGRLLRSPHFASAPRGQRFLRYVVEQTLKGNRDGLKERTIGVEVFERDPEYSTGDDAVVRVQAGDVRKRLDRFFAQPEAGELPVQISLPLGTYSPEFLFRQIAAPGIERATTAPVSRGTPSSAPDRSPAVPQHQFEREDISRRRITLRAIAGFSIVLAVCVPLLWWTAHRHSPSAFDEFWAPLTRPQQPVLLCVARAVPYYPSREFLIDHGATRSGEFHTEWQKLGKPFTLPPETPLRWGDLQEMQEFGVATGDVYSAVQLSLAFARMKKDTQLRVGNGYQFEDLRNSPSVLVGAFNNRWTMLISQGLPYRFFEDSAGIGIEESAGTRRRWRLSDLESRRQQDFAIIARLVNAETGQPVVIVGGIGASGTQAATEFVTNSSELNAALSELPRGWQKRNLEFVIGTTVTDQVAGPPSVISSTVW